MKMVIFNFMLKIPSKYTPSYINRKMVLKISSLELPHSKHVSKKNFLAKILKWYFFNYGIIPCFIMYFILISTCK